MGPEDSNRLPTLYEKCLVAFQLSERFINLVEARPAPSSLSGATVNDEILGILRNLRINNIV